MKEKLEQLCKDIPKAELHVHLEGTLEPEHLLELSERNKIKIPYQTVDEIRAAYTLENYNSFFLLYQQATTVIKTSYDFYEIAWRYFQKVSGQGVKHAEMFFDTQSYQSMCAEEIVDGIWQAFEQANKIFDISGSLILCFLRNLSLENAYKAFDQVKHHSDKICAVGLAGPENNYSPAPFAKLFDYANSLGFKRVCHAGENYSPDYIRQALDNLKVERIDHGVACMEDPHLVTLLAKQKIGLTVCPISNIALGIYKNLEDHPLKKMLQANLLVSINSDDPAFFGSAYIAQNYQQSLEKIGLSIKDLVICAHNSFISSFACEEKKQKYLKHLDEFCQKNNIR